MVASGSLDNTPNFKIDHTMKKLLFFAAILFAGTFTLQSCKSADGGCDALNGNHSMVVHKEVGKSL